MRNQFAISWGPRYLASRGFTEVITQTWAIGYAPGNGTALFNHLCAKGHTVEQLQDAGLVVITRTGRPIDRFRDRITAPVLDEDGHIVAFIGRASPAAPPSTPKYLNSPNSDLYRKHEILFGLAQAESRLAVGAQPVLVEGLWDAIAVSTDYRFAGLAPCGTALTAHHVDALARRAPVRDLGVIAAFDSDPAGHRAMLSAYEKLTSVTDHTYAVRLPPGRDPADLLQIGGPDYVANALDGLSHLADFVVDAVLDQAATAPDGYRPLDHAEGRLHALRASTAVLIGKPAADVHRQIRRIAERLGETVPTVMAAYVDNPRREIDLASTGLPTSRQALLRSFDRTAATDDRRALSARPRSPDLAPSR
nr:toprim domain-containing protein [Actinomadura rayongensis]